jgi:hypothetical protein
MSRALVALVLVPAGVAPAPGAAPLAAGGAGAFSPP